MKNIQTNLDINEISKDKNELKRYIISLTGMEKYSQHNRWQIEKITYDYSNMDKRLLSKMTYDYNTRVKRLEEGVELNQKFLTTIFSQYKPDASFYKQFPQKEIDDTAYSEYGTLNYAVFMYIMRDWTKESQKERELNYNPIIEQVKKYVKPKSKILIPGAALLRLGYELCKNDYDVDANDYNFTNVILCDYFFNHSKKNQFEFQPLIRSFSNYLSEDTVFRKYSFPDEDINLQGKGKLTLAGGDFTKLFNDKKEYYDCVITCFFIDTAKNIFEYIDIIEKVLKKGGIWINFGPLSYHWIGYQNIPTIELPYDKLKEVILNFGFEYLNEEKNKTITYCEIEGFMKNDVFQCVFFTAKKK
jgi:carnosine N-methyltransferase